MIIAQNTIQYKKSKIRDEIKQIMNELNSHDISAELSGSEIALRLGKEYMEHADAKHSAQKVAQRMAKAGILNERKDAKGKLWYSISNNE